MAYRRVPLAVDEWYHCYSRGVDKRKTFTTTRDYERFQQALFLSNDTKPTNRQNFNHLRHQDIFQLERGPQLVVVGAYCLMPNHFHILVKQIQDNGITEFMRKLGTSYAMYFNIKYKRVGNLFVKPFRSSHVGRDSYFKYVAQYIHLNIAEIYEPGWKQGAVESFEKLQEQMRSYRFSSFPDYCGTKRVESAVLGKEAIELFSDSRVVKDILSEAVEYYRNLEINP